MITKDTGNLPNLDYKAGEAILIDKPFLWTSYKVVRLINKAVDAKVGHAGTLDPRATGLLILCTGKKTKELASFQDQKKTYTGIITLGKRTASLDLETEIIEEKPFEHLKEEDILKARDRFTGPIMQIPPMYSAIKQKGKSLYHIARQGKEVNREPRQVIIDEFEITKIDLPDVYFKIVCSKGTYIRVIANDLGQALESGGVLSELRRTKIGDYSVDDAWQVNNFLEALERSS